MEPPRNGWFLCGILLKLPRKGTLKAGQLGFATFDLQIQRPFVFLFGVFFWGGFAAMLVANTKCGSFFWPTSIGSEQ